MGEGREKAALRLTFLQVSEKPSWKMESVPPASPWYPLLLFTQEVLLGGFFVVRAAHGQGRWKVLENDYPGGHPSPNNRWGVSGRISQLPATGQRGQL